LSGVAALPLVFASSAASANEWAACGHHLPPFHQVDATLGERTVITADEGRAIGQETYEMSGGVEFLRGNQLLRSESARYYKSEERLEASEGIFFATPDATFEGDSGSINLGDSSGNIGNARFQMRDKHARGDAEKIIFESQDVTILKDTTYTTCDPGREDWLLRSDKVRLDRATGVGSARHAVLSFMHVPFFYLPYISFPIDDRRKSGVLPPAYRSSDSSGSDFSIPYYLNLAPQRDATLTPRFLEKRGTMLGSEFRFMTERHYGELNLDYLSNDRVFGKERGQAKYQHEGRFTPHLTTNLDLNYASDADYFSELSNSLSLSSTTHLARTADLNYSGDLWQSRLRLQSYQTLNESIPEASRPYQRLPQITFSSLIPRKDNQIHYHLSGEYVYFDRTDRLTGSRLDLQPQVSLPLTTAASYLTPTLKLQNTTYSLNNQSDGVDSRFNRTVPLLSLDAGLFFERDSVVASRQYLHTLEPRLFYLYAPYRDQAALPLFDSGAPDFNFGRLFATNRFSGVDRVGDTSQLTTALTTRMIEKNSGKERFNASIGQILYLKDRKVGLNGDVIDRTNESDIVAKSSAYLRNDVVLDADYQWDVEADDTARGALQVRYKPSSRRIFNIGYRYRNATQEQLDVSMLWPLPFTSRWHFVGRWTQSLLDEQTIESFSGLEYESCCWKVHVVAHRFISQDLANQTGLDPYERSLFVQLELKGMGKLGKTVDELLENGILDYQH